jgi:hypothetical protein
MSLAQSRFLAESAVVNLRGRVIFTSICITITSHPFPLASKRSIFMGVCLLLFHAAFDCFNELLCYRLFATVISNIPVVNLLHNNHCNSELFDRNAQLILVAICLNDNYRTTVRLVIGTVSAVELLLLLLHYYYYYNQA